MSKFNNLQDERAFMEELANDLRERFPETTKKWRNAPPSLLLMGPQSSAGEEQGSLWGKYGNGKLCEHDSNARSDLRNRKNNL